MITLLDVSSTGHTSGYTASATTGYHVGEQSEIESNVIIHTKMDILTARMAARLIARRLGFSPSDQVRIATIVSELSRTILSNAPSGQVITRRIKRNGRVGIGFEFKDYSPMQDEPGALYQACTSTIATRHQDFFYARDFMDEFTLEMEVGGSTTMTCCKWLSGNPDQKLDAR
jgi:serine/threonine-protein kinase RsbT